MRWSRFPLGITCPDKIEQVESATMDAFASTVRTLAPTEAWSAACFDPPHRAARNVTHVGALVLDVDGKHNHNGTMEQARVALTGLPYVLHTTKSHTLTAPSFRVVIAISRAVSAKEFASLWRVGAQRLGAHGVRIDEATKDASRAWYAPPDAAEFVIADGSPLDVEEALRTATAQGRQARDPFTRAVARIASARPGERNKELFCAGVATRRLIEHGHIQADDAVAQLTAAAEQVGLERAEIDATIARALTRRPEDLAPISLDGSDYARVVGECCDALVEVENLFVRGGALVRVDERDDVVRLVPVSISQLTILLTELRTFRKMGKNGPREVWPPRELLGGVLQADHRRLRTLVAVLDSPSVSTSGELLVEHGYHAATQSFVCAAGLVVNVPSHPTQEDAQVAYRSLRTLLCDFPFRREVDAASAISILLTAVARVAFEGASPLFAISANTRGSGKSLVVEVLVTIVTGRAPAVTTVPGSDDEFRKAVGAHLLSGSNWLVLDNADAPIRLRSLDSLITAERFSTRLLGHNQMIEAPSRMVIVVNGNSLELGGDLSRRALPIDLRVEVARPEERTGFRIRDIRAHVREKREVYLAHALTILRAHSVAGYPACGVKELGSFEAWSRTIASAVSFASGLDPLSGRRGTSTTADRDEETLGELLTTWAECFGAPTTVGRALDAAYPRDGSTPKKDKLPELREVLEEIAPLASGRPNAKRIGAFIARHEHRIVNGLYFLSKGKGHGGLRVWEVALADSGGGANNNASVSDEAEVDPIHTDEDDEEGERDEQQH